MIIAITSQKGGTGKTTTAQATAAGMTAEGLRVLLIDMDPQGNLTMAAGAEASPEQSLMAALTLREPLELAITQTIGGDLIPATQGLAAADVTITETGREHRLREALEPLRSRYDHIILDTPPSLGLLTVNALTAAEGIIIPAQADVFSLQGIVQLHDTIKTIRRYSNPTLEILGILLTRHNPRTIIGRDLSEALQGLAETLGTKIYRQTVREAVAVREAQAQRLTLFEYAPAAPVTDDYRAYIHELLQDVQQRNNRKILQSEIVITGKDCI